MHSEQQKIKFAVIGCGHIGKRHATLIAQNPHAELAALCDIRAEARTETSGFQVPFFQSVDELLASGISIDVVNICTPNGLHAQQAIQALEHGMHVVCEKPMGLSKSECEAVIFKSLQMSKHVFCVMQNRYSPPSVWLKNVVSNKILGEIFLVQINCYWNRDERYYQKSSWKGTKTWMAARFYTIFPFYRYPLLGFRRY